MAGDHKCPVCSSTFTRPQHVARHMRSHTGDRPYKCQHCGDQFARSDLLSRHVNKCHASERPPTTTAPNNNRRKGTAAASRAATSKQACDQCVTSSLPCDGCNPCSKCVQRKCRCTYVKFHRQTAPAGPGHPPPNTLPQHPHRSSISLGARVPDEFILGPVPPQGGLNNVVPTMYIPHDYPLPSASLYSTNPYDPRQSPTPSIAMSTASRDSAETSPDLMARYRAQAAMLSRANVLTNGNLGAHGMAGHGLYAEPSQLVRFPGVGLDEYGRPFPGGGGSAALAAHPPTHGSASGFSDLQLEPTHAYAPGTGTGGGIPFPQHHSGSSPAHIHADAHALQRRSEELNDDFGSDSAHSVPSSANSSSVNLPMDRHSQHGQSRMYAASAVYHTSGHNDRKDDVGEGGFSSAFGLMSLDDPSVLAGLSNDSEPFFSALNAPQFQTTGGEPAHSHEHSANSSSTSLHSDASLSSAGGSSHTSNSSATSASHNDSNASLSLATPTPDLIASLKNGGLLSAGGREVLDSKELREFWKQYMRTPLTGPGSGNMLFPLQTPTGPGQQLGSATPAGSRPTPSRRHSRVASLPSMKTPPIFIGNFAGLGSTGGASQELDTFAQHGNFNLSFQPKSKGRNEQEAHAETGEQEQAIGHKVQYSSVRTTLHGDGDDLKSYERAVLARKAPTTLNLVPRRRGTMPAGTTAPSRSAIMGSGASGIGAPGAIGSANKLAQYFGRDESSSGGNDADRPGSSSTSSSFVDAYGPSSAAFSSQQLHQYVYHSQSSSESPPGNRESSVGAESDSGVSSSSPSTGYRPSFKRLASQTLGPPNAKRALLGPAGWDERETSEEAFDEEEEDREQAVGDMRRTDRLIRGPGRRFSLPAGHGTGGLTGGPNAITLPPIRTTAEHAEAQAAQA